MTLSFTIIKNDSVYNKGMARFMDRAEAGRELAARLKKFKGDSKAVVVGLPRGGMVVAFHLAYSLRLPMDFLVAKKLGAPGDPELAIGAVTEDGESYLDEEIVRGEGVEKIYIEKELREKAEEAKRRTELYRGSKVAPSLAGKTVILVDDGMATGATMLAAVASAKKREAERVIVAVPVASKEAMEKIRARVDGVVCLKEDRYLSSVGEYYESFPQVEDSEVMEILKGSDD
jgi:putative phosphoribosyl transferase